MEKEHRSYLTDKDIFDRLVMSMISKNMDNFIKLLKSISNINFRDTLGRTLLMYACLYGCLEFVKYLLCLDRAGINCKDVDNKTALSFVLQRPQDKYERIEIIKELAKVA